MHLHRRRARRLDLQMLLVPVKPETGEPARVLYIVPKPDDADEADEPETDAR